MTIYIASRNETNERKAFTSLIGACRYLGVAYGSAARGKRIWLKNRSTLVIEKMELVKTKRQEKVKRSKFGK